MDTSTDAVIRVDDLAKTFRVGFRRRRVDALRGVSFSVARGQIFGFLGPNGAGKTTTIKTIVGLLRPSRGTCHLLGRPAGDIAARRQVGYLPESPYFYDNLLPEEFMDLCGRLRGLGSKERKKASSELLEQLGLSNALDRQLRKFSKGMLQRIGLAQALLGDPDLLILDEPMTGLDPVGRKEVRDLIVSLKKQGRTVFFSSHILADVEMICDGVAIVEGGRVVAEGSLHELLAPAVRIVDLELTAVSDELKEKLARESSSVSDQGEIIHVEVRGEQEADRVLRMALEAGARARAMIPRRETLENLFVRQALGKND